MARRVFMSASLFKMSKSGYDAVTASPENLLFDANGQPYNGAYLVGVLSNGAFSESSGGVGGGGTSYTRTGTIVFGKAFPAPPRVLIGCYDPAMGGFTSNVTFGNVGQGSTSGAVTGSALNLSYVVGTTTAVVTINYVYYSGSGFNRFLDVSYVIFQV